MFTFIYCLLLYVMIGAIYILWDAPTRLEIKCYGSMCILICWLLWLPAFIGQIVFFIIFETYNLFARGIEKLKGER